MEVMLDMPPVLNRPALDAWSVVRNNTMMAG